MRKEHPISYTPEMIRARREGRKSVTRRIILPQPEVFDNAGRPDYSCLSDPKRNWQVGDLLWVKETYCHGVEWDDCKPSKVDLLCGGNDIWYFADGPRPTEGWGKKRSAMFMPKWAARSWDEIVSIRVEQLWEITEEDAIREGISGYSAHGGGTHFNPVMIYPAFPEKGGGFSTAKEAYECLWDSIDAKRGYPWDTNWWVFRIEFKEYPK